MDKSLISVIVPVYNGERYIEECVDSILKQTYPYFEIIMVDDCSTDNSLNICKEISKKDNRIKVVEREKNGGVSECRLTGLYNSEGDWIIYVDDDDKITPDCLETYIRIGKSNKNIDIVAGGVGESFFREKDDNIPVINEGIDVIKRYFNDPMIKTSHESKLYRKTLFEKVSIDNYRKKCPIAFFDDILITPILLGTARLVAVIPGVYYLHREVMTSISRSGLLNSFYYDHIEAGNILMNYFKEKGCHDSLKSMVTRYLTNMMRIVVLMDYFDIGTTQKGIYKTKINGYYHKYFHFYWKQGKDSRLHKIVFSMYRICPNIWKQIIKKTYYRNYRKEHNL